MFKIALLCILTYLVSRDALFSWMMKWSFILFCDILKFWRHSQQKNDINKCFFFWCSLRLFGLANDSLQKLQSYKTSPAVCISSATFALTDWSSTGWLYKRETIFSKFVLLLSSGITGWFCAMTLRKKKKSCKIEVDNKKLSKYQSKLTLLSHISKKNCALLPYLSDESLHTLGEFIFNVILQRVKLTPKQSKKVRNILKNDKEFYVKLISEKNKKPITYLRQRLSEPQVGKGIVSLVATLAPLIASLFLNK